MKQLSYELNNSNEIDEVLEKVNQDEAYKKARTRLLHIYYPIYIEENLKDLLGFIKQFDHDLKIVGLTSFDVICNGKKHEDKIILSFTFFMDSEVDIHVYDFNYKVQSETVCYFKEILNKTEDIAGIQMFSTSTYTLHAGLLENLANDNYPIFGGVAAQTDSEHFEKARVFTDQIYNNAVILVVYKGASLHINADFCLGWRPLGKEMTITSVTKDFCVEEIDGLPAAYVYDKYLNVKPNKYFLDNTFEFPLSLQRNGQLISRSSYKMDEKGRLYFNADIYQGEQVRLSYGNAKYVLRDAFKLSEKMKKFNAEAMFLIACFNRKVLLKEEANKEISFFEKLSPNLSGCYAFSEFMRFGEKGGVLHSSLVAVAMREGDVTAYNEENEKIRKDHEEVMEKIPFTERLMHFLEATTQDLIQMATTDQLTGLMNRRSMEERFTFECSKRKNKDKISIILIDIDHFKKINDVYGHDKGDQVLVKLAEIFKQSIRIEDAAGRWGGEEFIILLADTQLYGAKEVAERIRTSVENFVMPGICGITISAGVTLMKENENISQVLVRADKALYQAKEQGRNRIISVI